MQRTIMAKVMFKKLVENLYDNSNIDDEDDYIKEYIQECCDHRERQGAIEYGKGEWKKKTPDEFLEELYEELLDIQVWTNLMVRQGVNNLVKIKERMDNIGTFVNKEPKE